MESMTEEEAFALDEYYTNNPPEVDPSKARIRIPMVRVDNITAEYLAEKAKTTKKKNRRNFGWLNTGKTCRNACFSLGCPASLASAIQ